MLYAYLQPTLKRFQKNTRGKLSVLPLEQKISLFQSTELNKIVGQLVNEGQDSVKNFENLLTKLSSNISTLKELLTARKEALKTVDNDKRIRNPLTAQQKQQNERALKNINKNIKKAEKAIKELQADYEKNPTQYKEALKKGGTAILIGLIISLLSVTGLIIPIYQYLKSQEETDLP